MKPITRIAVLVLLLGFLVGAAAELARGQGPANRQTAVFKTVFDGITTAQASSALPNIGQSQHIIVVIFPDESAAVSSIQVRLEASFDGSTWFAVSEDITTAALVGGIVYRLGVSWGPFPYLRVNSLAATPSGEEMTVYYSGSEYPVQANPQEKGDRITL